MSASDPVPAPAAPPHAPRRAIITLDGIDPAVQSALGPELDRALPRAVLTIGGDGCGRIEIVIEAEDTSSLRAAMNSVLRWTDVAAGAARTGRAAGFTPSPAVSSPVPSARSDPE